MFFHLKGGTCTECSVQPLQLRQVQAEKTETGESTSRTFHFVIVECVMIDGRASQSPLAVSLLASLAAWNPKRKCFKSLIPAACDVRHCLKQSSAAEFLSALVCNLCLSAVLWQLIDSAIVRTSAEGPFPLDLKFKAAIWLANRHV